MREDREGRDRIVGEGEEKEWNGKMKNKNKNYHAK